MEKQFKKTVSTFIVLTGLSLLLIACSGGDSGMGSPSNKSSVSEKIK